MKLRVTFNTLAERELNEAIEYYEHEDPGLGLAFLTEIRRTTAAIVQFPDSGRIVLGSVRYRLCQRFPYSILYRSTENEIRILAVMNQKRRPGYWIGRRQAVSDKSIWPANGCDRRAASLPCINDACTSPAIMGVPGASHRLVSLALGWQSDLPDTA